MLIDISVCCNKPKQVLDLNHGLLDQNYKDAVPWKAAEKNTVHCFLSFLVGISHHSPRSSHTHAFGILPGEPGFPGLRPVGLW